MLTQAECLFRKRLPNHNHLPPGRGRGYRWLGDGEGWGAVGGKEGFSLKIFDVI